MKNKKQSIFSQNLIRFRKERGLSQKELSKKTGISQRMIAYYENNRISPPIEKAKEIANALSIPINDLLGIKDQVEDLFTSIDPRTLKRIKQLINFSNLEKYIIYTIMDSLIDKRKKKQKKQSADSKK